MTGARQGYTKTGKSLKAVRRYYALKNANRQRRSPPEEENRQQRDDSDVIKRKKSRTEEKLSKRIAAELKVQQEANERRAANVTKSTSFNLTPTDRSALPVNVAAVYQQGKQTGGPIFVLENDGQAEPTSPDRSPKSAKSVRSIKSGKSGKSAKSASGTTRTIGTAGTAVPGKSTSGTVGQIAEAAPQEPMSVVHSALTGCLIACFVFAAVYTVTWIYTALMKGKATGGVGKPKEDALVSPIKWVAISSIPILVAVPYWLIRRHQIGHAIASLVLMVLGTLSIFVCLIYKAAIEQRPGTQNEQKYYFGLMNPLHFWLSIIYFLSLLISTIYMLRQILNLVSRQMQDRLGPTVNDAQMSMLLSPH